MSLSAAERQREYRQRWAFDNRSKGNKWIAVKNQ